MTNPIPLHVAVAGFSGSGKTTLLEALLPRLREEGMKVGYLKPHAHRIDLDKSGKDTERMRRAGAAAHARRFSRYTSVTRAESVARRSSR